MVKKTILKVKNGNKADNIAVFAISSAESDLRICMKINLKLAINLTLDENHEVQIKEESIPFRRYHYEIEEGIEKYDLLVNRTDGYCLFPELKQIDYIFILSTEGSIKSIEQLLADLKKEQEFTVFYKVDVESLKSLKRIVI